MAESSNAEGGTAVEAQDEPRIVFPEGDDDDDNGNPEDGLYHSERRDEVRPSVVDPDAAAASATTSTTTHPKPEDLVIPTEDKDLASKRKLAGITYFSDPGQQTAIIREQREKLKSSGGTSGTNSKSGADNNPAGSSNANPEDDDEKEDVKPTTTITGDDEMSTIRPKSYLAAMTPTTDQQLKDRELKEREKAMRPSYLNALDSEAFSVNDESNNNNNDPGTNNNGIRPQQQPVIVSQPGAHSHGGMMRSSILSNDNASKRSITIGEDNDNTSNSFSNSATGALSLASHRHLATPHPILPS